MPIIPKCMSTQHPDNATAPPYAVDGVIKGEGEITEAVEVFDLGCDEQMWDSEGKDADTHVVQKLLTGYPDLFRVRHKLGRDCAITLRVPNPAIEVEMRKSLVEALQGITTSCDIASGFYGEQAEPPIQEVILPFTTNSAELRHIAAYYERFIVGQENQALEGDTTVQDWIGQFQPKTIRVIPLVEDLDHMVTVDEIVGGYMEGRELPFQRVFLARSDPALNYGHVGAELMLKIALQRLAALEQRSGVAIYPIIGVGAVPFRGHLTPLNVDRAFREYPSVQTLTVQSAFKFDYPEGAVRKGIAQILGHHRSAPVAVDEARCREVLDRFAAEYQARVKELAPRIAAASARVPRRRERKLHVGLFGYGRSLAGSSDVTLPRAIAFTAALYSIGVPPEILGMTAMSEDDLDFLREVCPSLEGDLAVALRYVNETRVRELLGDDYVRVVGRFCGDIDRVHEGLTAAVWAGIEEGPDVHVTHLIEEAARRRRFLG